MTRKAHKLSIRQKLASWRYGLVVSIFAVATIIVSWRIVDLQVIDRHFLQNEGDKRAIRYGEIVAHRGMILDRNGEPLAVSTPVITIWANPKELIDHPERWPDLARSIGMSSDRLGDKVRSNKGKEFIYLKRRMTPSRGKKVLSLKVPGVYGIDEYRRYYPAGEVASHIVGFTNIDDKGQEGMELAYNDWLTGKPGRVRLVKDRRGRLVRSAEVIDSAEPGHTLKLSLDLRIQYRAYQELKKAVERFKARSGSAVVLDIHTGEVLAMVNQPSYNPNNRKHLNIAATRNRAMTDVIEPGSTIKPLTIAAALSTGKYQPDTPIDTSPGWLRLRSGYYVRDTRDFGPLDVATVLKKSSNIGVSKMAWDIGVEKVWHMFWSAGLGQSSGTGFPGERTGSLPNRLRWAPIQVANLAFGYGFSVTALQLAGAEAAIASGGVYHSPSLLKLDKPPEGTRIMSEKVAHEVTRMMEGVVEPGGTGTRAAIPGYWVAGKTGTAHQAKAGGYARDNYVGTFVGFAPATNPRLAVVVVINSPSSGKYYGGLVAAPAFAQIMGDSLRLLGIEPDKPQALVQAPHSEAKSKG